MSTLGVLEELPFRNPNQISYPEPLSPMVQNLARAEEEDS